MPRKKTHEEFVNEVLSLVSDEYSILETYINSSTKILFRHNLCGYEYKVSPNNFVSRGNRCPNCFGTTKKTQQQFEEEVYRLVKDEYSVLGNYITNHTHIKMRHNKCGYTYHVSPIEFTGSHQRRCPSCYGNIKLTSDEIFQRIQKILGDNYEIISLSCAGIQEEVSIKHLICGTEYRKKPKDIFYQEPKCPTCARNQILTHEEFKDRVNSIAGKEYTVLGQYINSSKSILMKHNKCNHVFYVRPGDFFHKKSRCPKCGGKWKRKHEDFVNEVKSLTNNEYLVIGTFKGTKKKIKLKHILCGNTFETKPNYILHLNSRCPICNESRGERKIRELLQQNDIHFIREYIFNDCINNRPLRFDFAIFDKKEGGDLLFLIEYQGIQHYKPVQFFGGQKQYKERSINDNIKKYYCEEKGIKLITIHYQEYNDIEQKLHNIFQMCDIK